MSGLLSLVLLLGATPPAQPAAWHGDLASIRRAAATLRTVQASFVQSRTLGMLKQPLISHGIVRFRQPGDLRWEYTSPLATLFVVRAGHAQRLFEHDGEWLSDASARLPAVSAVLGEVALWLAGNFAASRAFTPRLKPATRDQPAQVELFPLDPTQGKLIARITLTLGAQPGTISAIDIFEPADGVTHIAFASPRYDEAISDESFTPP